MFNFGFLSLRYHMSIHDSKAVYVILLESSSFSPYFLEEIESIPTICVTQSVTFPFLISIFIKSNSFTIVKERWIFRHLINLFSTHLIPLLVILWKNIRKRKKYHFIFLCEVPDSEKKFDYGIFIESSKTSRRKLHFFGPDSRMFAGFLYSSPSSHYLFSHLCRDCGREEKKATKNIFHALRLSFSISCDSFSSKMKRMWKRKTWKVNEFPFSIGWRYLSRQAAS